VPDSEQMASFCVSDDEQSVFIPDRCLACYGCFLGGGEGRWDSTVGIATPYGLDSPGIEFRWGRVFPHLSRPDLGHTQPPIQWVPGLSSGKAAGAWRWPHTQSSVEVKERIQLYLYYLSGSSWPVLG
jgi:hypothetical protein